MWPQPTKRRHYSFNGALDPKGHQKKKKNFSSSMVVMGFHDDQRIGGQLTGLMRSIKDEHSRVDEITPKTSPRNTHITNENSVAIHCL